jgi:hypothetical protein
MATKKKKKKAWEPTPAPAPLPRSLSDEWAQLSPILGELGGMGMEQYISGQKELTQYQYDFFRQHYPEIAEMQLEQQLGATKAVREQGLQWLQQYGPAAQAAYEAANPRVARGLQTIEQGIAGLSQYEPLLGGLRTLAQEQLRTGPTTAFTGELDRRALAELQLGGALSPEEERAVQQSARGAFAARGQALGGASALAEVLNRESFSRARMREREAIAGGREALGIQRQQLGQALASSVIQQGLGFETGRAGLGSELARMAEGTGIAKNFLGMTGQAMPASTLMGFAQGVRTPDPYGIMGAGLTYGADVFNTNLNMAASMYNSYQNNMAALQGAKLQAAAQVESARLQASAFGGGGGGGGGIFGSLFGAGAGALGGGLAGGLGAAAGGTSVTAGVLGGLGAGLAAF